MSEKSFNQQLEDEIFIRDILDFIVSFWKILLGFSLFGFLGSVVFLAITPDQFEAKAQIQMAQISASSSNNNNNNTNPLGVNVEEPNLLLARMRQPTIYSEAEIKACGLENKKIPEESLVAMSRFSTVKGVDSIVELKIRMESKEQAVICAQALFENIRVSQNQIIKPYIEEVKILLSKYQDRLKEARELVTRADKSGAALSAAYLANRDEVKYLMDESIRLNTFVTAGEIRQTKLISPIYASKTPIFPRPTTTLVTGLLGGFFLGLLLAMMCKIFGGYKVSRQ